MCFFVLKWKTNCHSNHRKVIKVVGSILARMKVRKIFKKRKLRMSCTLFMVNCTRFGEFVCRHNIRYTLCYVYRTIIQKEPAHWILGLNNAWALTRWIIWLNKGRTAPYLKLRTYFHRMIMVSCIVDAAVCWCLRSFQVWRDFVIFPLDESSFDDRLHCIGI